jgi:predicted enzyme related to lactoylglutathione lyase
MKVEKLDRVAVAVKELDVVKKFLSDLFETTFERSPVEAIEKRTTDFARSASGEWQTRYVNVFISPLGLELVQTDPPCEREGVLSFHLKVSNLEDVKREMEKRGGALID